MTEPKSHGRLAVRPSLKPRELMAEPEVAGAWTARIVTLFPEAFPGILGLSLTGKALAQGLWNLQTIPLREHGIGRHRNVDDTPAGGGAGMVIRPDVLEKIVATVPVKRLGEPSEIASIISWLASEEGGYSTGAELSVNGGLHMN